MREHDATTDRLEQLRIREPYVLDAIYEQHRPACLALARRILRRETLAEEVVQDVFFRLWSAPERFDPERGSLRTFLFANVHGRAIDAMRAERSRRGREVRDARAATTTGPCPADQALRRAAAEALHAALRDLSAGEREAISLAYFGGHTYREVARLLDEPEGTIKSRIRSGLLRLNAQLGPELVAA